MPERKPDAFTIWGNFYKDKEKAGHHWASMEVPTEEA